MLHSRKNINLKKKVGEEEKEEVYGGREQILLAFLFYINLLKSAAPFSELATNIRMIY